EHIEVLAPLWRRHQKDLYEAGTDILYGLHRICNDERTQRRATNDDILPRLPDHLDMAAHGHEAADHGTERYDEPDDDRHAESLLFLRCRPRLGVHACASLSAADLRHLRSRLFTSVSRKVRVGS